MKTEQELKAIAFDTFLKAAEGLPVSHNLSIAAMTLNMCLQAEKIKQYNENQAKG